MLRHCRSVSEGTTSTGVTLRGGNYVQFPLIRSRSESRVRARSAKPGAAPRQARRGAAVLPPLAGQRNRLLLLSRTCLTLFVLAISSTVALAQTVPAAPTRLTT